METSSIQQQARQISLSCPSEALGRVLLSISDKFSLAGMEVALVGDWKKESLNPGKMH